MEDERQHRQEGVALRGGEKRRGEGEGLLEVASATKTLNRLNGGIPGRERAEEQTGESDAQHANDLSLGGGFCKWIIDRWLDPDDDA